MLNFLGIGAQKAGTTWLYERLSAHPAILFPAGKEVHFWNANRDKGLDWYIGQFAGELAGTIKGEITPAYQILDASQIREIHAINPALRLLFIVRNPVERAWSAALMRVKNRDLVYEETPDAWFVEQFHADTSLSRGDYETSLRTWLDIFPIEQLLVMRYEHITTDPVGLLADCASHLGVDRNYFAGQDPQALSEKVFGGLGHPLRPSLLPVLREIYTPRIRRLEQFLGMEFSGWVDGAANS